MNNSCKLKHTSRACAAGGHQLIIKLKVWIHGIALTPPKTSKIPEIPWYTAPRSIPLIYITKDQMEKQTLTMNWPPLNYRSNPLKLLHIFSSPSTSCLHTHTQCIYHQSPTLPSPVYPLQIIFTSKTRLTASGIPPPWLKQEKQNKGARELNYTTTY